MNHHTTWADFQCNLRDTPEAERYRLQPELDRLIQRLKRQGSPVPPEARHLNTELQAEAVEAQFDNVPV